MTAFPRVLLVSAKAKQGYNIAPPLGLYQLRLFVCERGVDCELLDRELDDPQPYLERAEAGEFDIIGFSVTHFNMLEDLELLHAFRSASTRSGRRGLILAGGPEATINHAQWLGLGVDMIIVGFGEKPLLELCERVRRLDRLDMADLDLPALVAGMDATCYVGKDGDIVYTPARAFQVGEFRELFYHQILKLDLPYQRYWDRQRAEWSDPEVGGADFIIENVRLYTTSHCPRNCGFCNTQTFLPMSMQQKVPITWLAAEDVASLVEHFCARFGATSFLFSDDDFPVGNRLGLERLSRFCELVLEMKSAGRILPNVRFSCQARIMDFILPGPERAVNLALLELMAKAGFMSMGMGVETFIDRALRAPSINKVGCTSGDIHNVLGAMLDVGLVPQVNQILGIPEYTPEELLESMEHVVHYYSRGCDSAVIKYVWALTGAPIYGKNLYEVVYKKWTNPVTGEDIKEADYYKPYHPEVARAMELIDDAAAEELKKVVDAQGWHGKTVHKRIIGMTTLLAVFRLLGRDDLAEKHRPVLDGMLTHRLRSTARTAAE